MKSVLAAWLVLGSGALALHGREDGVQVLGAVAMQVAALSIARGSRRKAATPAL